jgi:GTP-binding protein
MVIAVPVGTIATNVETGELVCEVLEDGQKQLVAKGGKRGLGNIRFLSSRHQAPEESTAGGDRVELDLRLELKIIADVGLAGFPNAGKSTFLSAVSAAKPKIADYPFTTLVPQLGVVDFFAETGEWGRSIVIADIPGLIEGASEGKGLGLDFLRHLERTKLLLYLIDPNVPDVSLEDIDGKGPWDRFETLRAELDAYGRGLDKKAFVVALSKSDTYSEELAKQWLLEFEKRGIRAFSISSATGEGLRDLKLKLMQAVEEEKEKVTFEESTSDSFIDKEKEQYETIVKSNDDDLL